MKIFLLAVSLCLSLVSFCQKKKEYYDYYFKPTTGKGRYTVITEPNGDIWKRTAYYNASNVKAMEVASKDEDGKIKEGTEYWYYENKQLKSKIDYKNGKKSGVATHFSESGKLLDSAKYLNDHVVGVKVVWNTDGSVLDSIRYDGNGNGFLTSYNKDGKIIAQGKFVNEDKPDGEWKHYYPNGKTQSVYQYAKGKVITSNCFDEEGKPRTDGLCGEFEAEFPGGDKAWNNYVAKNFDVNALAKKKIPSGLYQIVVKFIVGSDGSVEDVKAVTNYGYGMEAEAEKAIRNSPKWKPAMQNGKYVKAYREQPITFSIGKE